MITKLRARMRDESGFTLIELMLVVVVLGVLAGIAVPRMGGVRDQADESAVKSNLRAMQSSLEMYYVQEGEYPDSDTDLGGSEFISGDLVSIFEDGGNDNYAYFSDGGDDYRIVYDSDSTTDDDNNEFYITDDGGASWTN